MKETEDNTHTNGNGSSNIHQKETVVSESVKNCLKFGEICKDPLGSTSYTIQWPEPSLMTLLLIKKPNDATIDEWAAKIIE